MEKSKITVEKAIEDVRSLFNIDSVDSISKEHKGVFMISKKEFERDEVLKILGDYFKDKYIDGGKCEINPLTLMNTIFKIEKL